MRRYEFEVGQCIYDNPLHRLEDVKDWITEGQVRKRIIKQALHLENELDPEEYGDYSHWVFWCPVEFPDKISVTWKFSPIQEPGLCMLFLAANGKNGEDLFDPSLPKRTGYYPDYHSGAINTLHLSYFRHKYPEERAFRTCNLRKSSGFHLVESGADPLPPVCDAISPYHMQIIKYEGIVQVSINQLTVLEWVDDGKSHGPLLTGGKIGFRQMAPMVAAYQDLQVHRVSLK